MQKSSGVLFAGVRDCAPRVKDDYDNDVVDGLCNGRIFVIGAFNVIFQLNTASN